MTSPPAAKATSSMSPFAIITLLSLSLLSCCDPRRALRKPSPTPPATSVDPAFELARRPVYPDPKPDRSAPLSAALLALSPTSSLLAAGANDGRVHLLSASTLTEQRAWPCALVRAVAFSADDRRVAIACRHATDPYKADVQVFGVASDGPPTASFSFGAPVRSLAFRGDQLLVLSGRRLTRHALTPSPGEPSSVEATIVAPDGSSWCFETEGKGFERPMPGGGREWGEEGHSITCTVDGAPPREIAADTHASVSPVVGGYILSDLYGSSLFSPSGERRGRVAHGFIGGHPLPDIDGKHLAAIDGSYTVLLFETSTGRLLWSHSLRERAILAVSREGVVFAATATKIVRLASP